ncbi:hypothetical protein AVEN_173201-1 [Araneus ventricosus]|uniref:Uncharacterized protein n=1 Tax=Araneus ventricosus TaxID=182803 RepID=A0A4Y2TYE5_ARAVE|nr:hypothetical protein AVEN_173201-1 [Araneus ventricosus]
MFPTSREGHRGAVERRNLGGHSISCGRPLRVLWHRRDLLWIPQPPAKYVRGEVLGSRVCCVGVTEWLSCDTEANQLYTDEEIISLVQNKPPDDSDLEETDEPQNVLVSHSEAANTLETALRYIE